MPTSFVMARCNYRMYSNGMATVEERKISRNVGDTYLYCLVLETEAVQSVDGFLCIFSSMIIDEPVAEALS